MSGTDRRAWWRALLIRPTHGVLISLAGLAVAAILLLGVTGMADSTGTDSTPTQTVTIAPDGADNSFAPGFLASASAPPSTPGHPRPATGAASTAPGGTDAPGLGVGAPGAGGTGAGGTGAGGTGGTGSGTGTGSTGGSGSGRTTPPPTGSSTTGGHSGTTPPPATSTTTPPAQTSTDTPPPTHTDTPTPPPTSPSPKCLVPDPIHTGQCLVPYPTLP